MKQIKATGVRILIQFYTGIFLLIAMSVNVHAAESAPPPSQFVIVISVDGLGGTYLNKLFEGTATGGPYALPNFTRIKNEGAGTLAAHCDNNNWETLPNHTSIITARPRDGVGGHAWSSNSDPLAGQTIHTNKGSYVAGVFDVAHDNGLMTGMYVNKSKFMLFDTYGSYTNGGSYNAINGAVDTTGTDNGRDKIDTAYINTALGGIIVDTFIAQQKSANPNRYAFLHINEPDSFGHSKGWGSAIWNGQVVVVDTMLGKLFKLIEQDVPAMIGKTTIILTADHGNQYDPPSGADRYSVPFFVWGPGVPAGSDLYVLNSGRRQTASSYPMTTYSGMQPIRNAEANNLALQLLGLGPIPGSVFNATQDLQVAALPAVPAIVLENSGTITGSTASLNASVNTGGASTTVWYRFATLNPGSCNDTFGSRMPETGGLTVPAGSSPVAVFQEITGLSPGTAYFYCGIAQNTAGTSFSTVRTFSTDPTLTLSVTGNGTVSSRNSEGNSYACDTMNCEPFIFNFGKTVTLTATVSNSSFSSWGGDVISTETPLSFVMDANKNVTATFIPDPATVKIDGDESPLYSLARALDLPRQNATIRAKAIDFVETITHGNSNAVMLRGGFGTDFSDGEQTGFSTISGWMKIQNGRLAVEHFKIRP